MITVDRSHGTKYTIVAGTNSFHQECIVTGFIWAQHDTVAKILLGSLKH